MTKSASESTQHICWSIAKTEPDSARSRILVAAANLFCRQGFASTGIDAVIEEAGTAKATLYRHFPSKLALVEAVLDAEGKAWREWFFGRLALVHGSADQRLLAIFDVLTEWFEDPDFYGCTFINAVSEFEADNDVIREAAAKHKAHIMTWIVAQAMEIEHAEAQEIGRAFAVLIDGAIVAAQHAQDPSFAMTAKRLAERYLSSYGPQRVELKHVANFA